LILSKISYQNEVWYVIADSIGDITNDGGVLHGQIRFISENELLKRINADQVNAPWLFPISNIYQ